MLTIFLQKYREAKLICPDTILLFRIGDYYETFHDDAKNAARILGLTLAIRKGVPMAGFPYFHLDRYRDKLTQAGFNTTEL